MRLLWWKLIKNGADEPSQFFVVQKLRSFPFKKHVEKGKVETGDYHEKWDDIFDERGIPISYTGLFGGITAGSGGGKGVADGIKPIHPADIEKDS